MAIKPQKILMENNFTKKLKKIGQLIRNKRLEKCLTQQQLADRIPKIDRAKISDMENGKEDFYFSTLLKICDALETDIDFFLEDK